MSEEGFLSRWSRRKRAIEAGRPVGEPEVVATPDLAPPATPPAPEEPPFDITTLPAIDSLTAASDFTAFLRKEVPGALQRAALRRAWSLDPAIRDFVGPADYAWDYNAPDGVPGASLDLVGDLRERLAQVFGPEPAAEDVAPGGAVRGLPEGARVDVVPEGARVDVVPEGAADDHAPERERADVEPQGAEPDAAPRDIALDSARAADSLLPVPPLPAPDAATMLPPALLAETPAPEAGPPSRRHGSALPS
jgi:hypothetical protein